MRPVLVRRGRVVVHAYLALLYLGLTLGIPTGAFAAAREGLDGGRAYVALVALSAIALAGSRLLHVVSRRRVYLAEPRRVLRLRDGGGAMYGGLLLGLPLSVPLL